jgi:hypothetical protein
MPEPILEMFEFPVTKVRALSARALAAGRGSNRFPDGRWSVCDVDPMKILAVFKPLRLRKGWVLCGHRARVGKDSIAVPWAVREDRVWRAPPPKTPTNVIFRPPKAFADIRFFVEGDATPWSYLCASLFIRALRELGAMGMGHSWSTHTVVDKRPWEDPLVSAKAGRRDLWTRTGFPTESMTPRVTRSKSGWATRFWTFTHKPEPALFRNDDRFVKGYVLRTKTWKYAEHYKAPPPITDEEFERELEHVFGSE